MENKKIDLTSFCFLEEELKEMESYGIKGTKVELESLGGVHKNQI